MALLRLVLLFLAALFVSTAWAQSDHVVMAYPREFLNLVPQQGFVTVGPIELSVSGALPPGVTNELIRWQPDWDGRSAALSLPTTPVGRVVSTSITIPVSAFSQANNFTVALRPRVFLGTIEDTATFTAWIVVTLAYPAATAAPRLLVGEHLLGFGAAPQGKDISLHAQKTDVAKVDIDRPPLINPATNPTLDLSKDGLTEEGSDAEDTALHPRIFIRYAPGTNGNQFAYAEFIIATPDLIFHPLRPSEGATSDYDDRTQQIDGRRTDAPGEPVRMFTAIGARIVDRDYGTGNGKYLLFTGTLPGEK